MILLTISILGIAGVLLLPFFAYEHTNVWIQLGVNFCTLLAIIVWAGAHSVIIFGVLYYFKLLRIDNTTEYTGLDVAKHGESAYPAAAWIEAQYDAAVSILTSDGFTRNTRRRGSSANPSVVIPHPPDFAETDTRILSRISTETEIDEIANIEENSTENSAKR